MHHIGAGVHQCGAWNSGIKWPSGVQSQLIVWPMLYEQRELTATSDCYASDGMRVFSGLSKLGFTTQTEEDGSSTRLRGVSVEVV